LPYEGTKTGCAIDLFKEMSTYSGPGHALGLNVEQIYSNCIYYRQILWYPRMLNQGDQEHIYAKDNKIIGSEEKEVKNQALYIMCSCYIANSTN
jgi:hypothetical protein